MPPDVDEPSSRRRVLPRNTYAGHPCLCCALANLKIVEDERSIAMPARSALFLARLKDVQTRHRNIGDVRGWLMIVSNW